MVHAIAYLMRTRTIDRVVALDDFDVEVAGFLRDEFGWPGLRESDARRFRDKLTMRQCAAGLGIRQPDFSPLFVDEDVTRFLAHTRGPWLLKPRLQASAVGIQKLTDAESAWRTIEALGDGRAHHLVECMIDGAMYHVDALCADHRVRFAEVNQYHRPLLEVAHGGGIYATRTLPRGDALWPVLRAANDAVLEGLRLGRGASHTEFIIGAHDGHPYFIETSARVGGAHIAEMVEAASGINLWEEWASLEARGEGGAGAGGYTLPAQRSDYGGVVISLSRFASPDTSAFDDAEIVERITLKNHIGFVVRSPSSDRVEALLANYRERIASGYHAALPPAARPTT